MQISGKSDESESPMPALPLSVNRPSAARRCLRPLFALALGLLCPPLAHAQDTIPAPRDGGAVSQLLFAHALFDLALARKDPMASLAAARLAAGITETDSDRLPTPAGEAAAPSYPSAGLLFTLATALAQEDELTTDLLARSLAETGRLPGRNVIRASRGIAPGEAQLWSIPFPAASLAEIGMIGDGRADLDLSVADAEGRPLCLDTGPSDRALCSLRIETNQDIGITVTNRSETAASYSLLTN